MGSLGRFTSIIDNSGNVTGDPPTTGVSPLTPTLVTHETPAVNTSCAGSNLTKRPRIDSNEAQVKPAKIPRLNQSRPSQERIVSEGFGFLNHDNKEEKEAFQELPLKMKKFGPRKLLRPTKPNFKSSLHKKPGEKMSQGIDTQDFSCMTTPEVLQKMIGVLLPPFTEEMRAQYVTVSSTLEEILEEANADSQVNKDDINYTGNDFCADDSTQILDGDGSSEESLKERADKITPYFRQPWGKFRIRKFKKPSKKNMDEVLALDVTPRNSGSDPSLSGAQSRSKSIHHPTRRPQVEGNHGKTTKKTVKDSRPPLSVPLAPRSDDLDKKEFECELEAVTDLELIVNRQSEVEETLKLDTKPKLRRLVQQRDRDETGLAKVAKKEPELKETEAKKGQEVKEAREAREAKEAKEAKEKVAKVKEGGNVAKKVKVAEAKEAKKLKKVKEVKEVRGLEGEKMANKVKVAKETKEVKKLKKAEEVKDLEGEKMAKVKVAKEPEVKEKEVKEVKKVKAAKEPEMKVVKVVKKVKVAKEAKKVKEVKEAKEAKDLEGRKDVKKERESGRRERVGQREISADQLKNNQVQTLLKEKRDERRQRDEGTSSDQSKHRSTSKPNRSACSIRDAIQNESGDEDFQQIPALLLELELRVAGEIDNFTIAQKSAFDQIFERQRHLKETGYFEILQMVFGKLKTGEFDDDRKPVVLRQLNKVLCQIRKLRTNDIEMEKILNKLTRNHHSKAANNRKCEEDIVCTLRNFKYKSDLMTLSNTAQALIEGETRQRREEMPTAKQCDILEEICWRLAQISLRDEVKSCASTLETSTQQHKPAKSSSAHIKSKDQTEDSITHCQQRPHRNSIEAPGKGAICHNREYIQPSRKFKVVEASETWLWADNEIKAIVKGLKKFSGVDRFYVIKRTCGKVLEKRSEAEIKEKAIEVRTDLWKKGAVMAKWWEGF